MPRKKVPKGVVITPCSKGHERIRTKSGYVTCRVCDAIRQGRTPPGSKSSLSTPIGRFNSSVNGKG